MSEIPLDTFIDPELAMSLVAMSNILSLGIGVILGFLLAIITFSIGWYMCELKLRKEESNEK